MRLTVFLDAEGKRLDPPIFGIADDFSVILLDHALVLGGQFFDLLRGHILAREENVLVKRHEKPFQFVRQSGAEPPEPRKGSKILEGGNTGRRAIRPTA